MKRTTKSIYLDYAATTAVDSAVMRAMLPYFSTCFGNPGSLHSFGQEGSAALDAARAMIADALQASFREVIFTGSATEANATVIMGVPRAARLLMKQSTVPIRVIVSTIEHESVLESSRALEREGFEVVRIPVDRMGIVDCTALAEAINDRTALVSVQYANNEIGTIEPISKITDLVSRARKAAQHTRNGVPLPFPLFHTDAVQAIQFLPCDTKTIGADFMTLSAHKVYGPKGVGVLYARSDEKYMLPLVYGGGQEFSLRSGTENVPAIVGAAHAFSLAVRRREKEAIRVRTLRDIFWNMIKSASPRVVLNGCGINDSRRLANNINIHFPGQEAQFLLTKLDQSGVAASAGSACSARSPIPSHVLLAAGYSEKRSKESIRFTLGMHTTKAEIVRAARIIKNCAAS